jgi:histidyl-tRNA synthetase
MFTKVYNVKTTPSESSISFSIDGQQADVPMDSVIAVGPLLHSSGIRDWCKIDLEIVRGLAYYTGTVFEVIAEGERAVAGGGRYDNLIELFGGPPTPACGFGMGDAVLGNLLEDRKLIPEGREMLEALSRPMPLRPDVFVISSGKEGCDDQVVPTVARLRRGEESEEYRQGGCKPWSHERYTVPPRHARRSYKATKNVGKLLADAGACHARFAAIIESPERCTLKNLDSGEQAEVGLGEVGRRVAH